MVIYLSTDLEARTATFDVYGQSVTRQIASHIDDATLAEHLLALATGLSVEFTPSPVLTDVPVASGTVMVGD